MDRKRIGGRVRNGFMWLNIALVNTLMKLQVK
jgi:hypothetical protein